MHNYSLIIKLLYLIIYLSITGCYQSKSPDGFDTSLWIADHNGCNKERLKQYKVLLRDPEKMLGLNSKKVIKILGKPERNELYTRNQKFFIYHITPSSDCSTKYDGDKLFLFIRFNAVGLSQEIFVQDKPSFN